MGSFAPVKKFLVSIFAIFYLAISSGFTVRVHYCMDKLSGWELSLMNEKQPSCERCGMHMDDENTCCKDEQKVVKFDSDQKAPQLQNLVFHPVAIVQNLPQTNFSSTEIILPVNLTGNTTHEPLGLAMPLFMRHQNFRI